MSRLRELVQKIRDIFKICWNFIKFMVKSFWTAIKSIIAYLVQRLLELLASMGEETGILAIRLMVNRNLHIFERILWFITFIASIYGGIFIARLQIKRFVTSPTMISVDRNYRDWVGYMPAITLCYYDRIDPHRAHEYITENWNVSIIDEDFFYYGDFLLAVANATASNYADLAKFAEDKQFDGVDLLDLIKAIHQPLVQIVNTHDGEFEVPTMSVMTERGLCYLINSAMGEVLNGDSKIALSKFDDLAKTLSCNYGKQTCFIKVDLLQRTGTVDVHSPFEISSTDATSMDLHNSDEILASYKVLETVASNSLRGLRVDQRKCVFYDEETADLKIYSKTICLAKCRASMAVEMCNCVPFFYTFVDGPSCSTAGFECLLDFKWPVWALHICKCPNTCTEIGYTLHTIKKSSWGSNAVDETKTDSVTSSFRWDLVPPKVRMRRDVVFSFEDLLVSFGGIMALFLGVSLITVIGFGYSLTEHLCQDMWRLLKVLYRGIVVFYNYIKNRKKDNVNMEAQSISQNDSFLERLKRRRQKLVKLHWKSSDVNILANSPLTVEELGETDESSVFEFVN